MKRSGEEKFYVHWKLETEREFIFTNDKVIIVSKIQTFPRVTLYDKFLNKFLIKYQVFTFKIS